MLDQKLQAGLDWLKEFIGDVELSKIMGLRGFNNGLKYWAAATTSGSALDFLQKQRKKRLKLKKKRNVCVN